MSEHGANLVPSDTRAIIQQLGEIAADVEASGEPSIARMLFQAQLEIIDARVGTHDDAAIRTLRSIMRLYSRTKEFSMASVWAQQILRRTTDPKHVRAARQIVARERARTSGNSRSSSFSPNLCVPEAITPTVTFDDIGGLAYVKEQIHRLAILPMKDPETAARYGLHTGGGILLTGPPGCGKTLVAQAAAAEMGVPLFTASASDIQGHLMGMSERNLTSAFETARKAAPSVLFFDEIDAMTQSRTKDLYGAYRSLSNQFLVEMDGVQSNEGVLILGASNAPELIDQALQRPGRFDRCIHVGKPDIVAREAIWRISCHKHPAAGFLDFAVLAELSDGLSGADIAGVMRESAETVWMQSAQEGTPKDIEMTDVLLALREARVGGATKRRIDEMIDAMWSESLNGEW